MCNSQISKYHSNAKSRWISNGARKSGLNMIQHYNEKWTLMLSVAIKPIMLNVVMLSVIIPNIKSSASMPSVVLLIIIILNVIIPSVRMPSGVVLLIIARMFLYQ
jgi:hypothetical protein